MGETAAAVRERPILFSGEMVRAILAGTKSQTRRVVKPQPHNPEVPGASPVWGQGVHRHGEHSGRYMLHAAFDGAGRRVDRYLACPYGAPGDRLWVREAFTRCGCPACLAAWPNRGPHGLTHLATYVGNSDVYPRPSIHMPRWACRLTLEITEVRVERVQEISGEDARAEGVTVTRCGCEVCIRSSALCPADASAHIEEYAHLWDSLNAPRGFGWDANPWVWVITFRRAEG